MNALHHATGRVAGQPRAVRRGPSAIAVVPTPGASTSKGADRTHTTDVVVIGSGVGGLSCAGVLARYGFKVGAEVSDLASLCGACGNRDHLSFQSLHRCPLHAVLAIRDNKQLSCRTVCSKSGQGGTAT